MFKWLFVSGSFHILNKLLPVIAMFDVRIDITYSKIFTDAKQFL